MMCQEYLKGEGRLFGVLASLLPVLIAVGCWNNFNDHKGSLCIYTTRDNTYISTFMLEHPQSFAERLKSEGGGVKFECPDLVRYSAAELGERQVSNYDECPNELGLCRLGTSDLLKQLLNELENEGQIRADVIWGMGSVFLFQLVQDGRLEGYLPAGSQNFIDRNVGLDSFLDRRYRKEGDASPRWFATDAYMTTFCHPELTDGLAPRSWAALLDPSFTAPVSIPNPSVSGTGLLAVALLTATNDLETPILPSSVEDGWDFLETLYLKNMKDMAPGDAWPTSSSTPCKLAATGEVAVGITYDAKANTYAETGYDHDEDGSTAPLRVGMVFPEDGIGHDVHANALVLRESIKPLARTFMDWAMEEVELMAIEEPMTAWGIPEGVGGSAYSLDPKSQWVFAQLDTENRTGLSYISSLQADLIDAWRCRFDEEYERYCGPAHFDRCKRPPLSNGEPECP